MLGSAPDPIEESEIAIRSVLVVEDDPDMAGGVKAILENEGFLVRTASNGVEALREVLAGQFDAIVCDLMMPKMPGDMFYLAVRKAKPTLARRFVFLTGYATGDEKLDHFLKTADGPVVSKPIDTKDLLKGLSLVLRE